ncbi:alpha/beta fold hydrolase [Lentzea sp. E54]|uniref:alpha/beta fold hydrolase n=1 Tax=Lentzea xerophila TaxID=3435883 RepID=UPI003DA61265
MVVSGTAPAFAEQQQSVVPVEWATCSADLLAQVPVAERPNVTCATQQVPLDHSQPQGSTIGIVMMRRAATDQSNKIGSLFMNPGGPSASGLVYAAIAGRYLSPEVLSRFDIIGFDPRGVGSSSPLRCFQTAEEAAEVASRRRSVPLTAAEVSATMQASADYTAACAQNAGPLLHHMSTEDVARDLELLRKGVGDDHLNYVGMSYGTLLGATYANLYPNKVRALVLDGAVDPALRTTNGTEYDRQRAQGFEISLRELLAQCDAAGSRCYFSGNTQARYDELSAALREAPVLLPNGVLFTYEMLLNSVSSSLYDPAAFPLLTFGFQLIYQSLPSQAASRSAAPSSDPAQVDAFTQLGTSTRGQFDAPYTGNDAFYGVDCTDKPFLRIPQLYPIVMGLWDHESPTFGRWQASQALLTCATWPGPLFHRYAGPWHKQTANPIVVISNYFDPATRYTFGQRMAAWLGNSKLMSVNSLGHLSLGRSASVGAAVTRYLVDLQSPDTTTVYQPNQPAFP